MTALEWIMRQRQRSRFFGLLIRADLNINAAIRSLPLSYPNKRFGEYSLVWALVLHLEAIEFHKLIYFRSEAETFRIAKTGEDIYCFVLGKGKKRLLQLIRLQSRQTAGLRVGTYRAGRNAASFAI